MSLVMFVVWVLAGLLAAGLAGFVMRRGGYGLGADIVLGLVGSLVGSVILWGRGTVPEAGMVAVAIAFAARRPRSSPSARYGPSSSRDGTDSESFRVVWAGSERE